MRARYSDNTLETPSWLQAQLEFDVFEIFSLWKMWPRLFSFFSPPSPQYTMYSPRRTATDDYDTLLRSPENTNMVASPLRAIASPFYKAVKTAQNNASRDFDKFYGNLQQKLTPRTSQARIQKQTPATTEKTRFMLQQRRAQADYDSTRTSLTPLIERHTLREGGLRWL